MPDPIHTPVQVDLDGQPFNQKAVITREMFAAGLTAALADISLDQLVALMVNPIDATIDYLNLHDDQRVGQKISLLFNPHRLAVTSTSDPVGIYESLKDPKFIDGLARAMEFKNGKVKELLYQALQLGINAVYYVGEFPPHVARAIALAYNVSRASRVLDPCGGWGGRMIGFSTVADSYTCCEPSARTAAGLSKLAAWLQLFKSNFDVVIHEAPFEDVDLEPASYDFALTSPPYYDTEHYAPGEPTNSFNRYHSFDAWCSGFYEPLIHRTMAALKPGCAFVINIGSRKYPLNERLREIVGDRYQIGKDDSRLSGVAGLGKQWEGETFYVLINPGECVRPLTLQQPLSPVSAKPTVSVMDFILRQSREDTQDTETSHRDEDHQIAEASHWNEETQIAVASHAVKENHESKAGQHAPVTQTGIASQFTEEHHPSSASHDSAITQSVEASQNAQDTQSQLASQFAEDTHAPEASQLSKDTQTGIASHPSSETHLVEASHSSQDDQQPKTGHKSVDDQAPQTASQYTAGPQSELAIQREQDHQKPEESHYFEEHQIGQASHESLDTHPAQTNQGTEDNRSLSVSQATEEAQTSQAEKDTQDRQAAKELHDSEASQPISYTQNPVASQAAKDHQDVIASLQAQDDQFSQASHDLKDNQNLEASQIGLENQNPIASQPWQETQMAEALITHLIDHGHHILTRDGKLLISDASTLSTEIRAAIAVHRDALLAIARPVQSVEDTQLREASHEIEDPQPAEASQPRQDAQTMQASQHQEDTQRSLASHVTEDTQISKASHSREENHQYRASQDRADTHSNEASHSTPEYQILKASQAEQDPQLTTASQQREINHAPQASQDLERTQLEQASHAPLGHHKEKTSQAGKDTHQELASHLPQNAHAGLASQHLPDPQNGTTLFGHVDIAAPSLLAFLAANRDDTPNWVAQEPPQLDGIKNIILNFETNGLEWHKHHRPIGVTVGTLDGQLKRFLPFGFRGPGNLDENVIHRWYNREIRGKHITNANTKFECHMSRVWGHDLEEMGNTVSDVQHYAALLDDTRRKFNLDILAHDYLGGIDVERVDERQMANYEPQDVAARAEYQVTLVSQLRNVMWPLMDKEDLQRVRQLEDDVIFPVVEMEKNGAPINVPLLKQWCAETEQLQRDALKEVSDAVGFRMNPDSPTDWERLFAKFDIPIGGTTEGGKPSFTDKILKSIDNPYVQLSRKAGKLASLRSKFLVAYDEVIGADGLLRFSLHQCRTDEHGTVRGRFSASDKNIQQVMNHDTHIESFGTEDFFIRRLFIPGSGLLYESDAEQIEFRIFASYSKSKKLAKAYADDPSVSFHRVVWEMVKPFKPDIQYTKVKSLNFLKVYGGGKGKASAFLELPREESDQFCDMYDQAFPEVRATLKEAEMLARGRGYVKSVLGRRARFADPKFAYKALNAVIQPSAADIFKRKVVEVHAERKQTGFVMRMPVHDALIGDVPDVESGRMVRAILNRQSFPQITIPILWSGKMGPNWAECK